MTDRPTNHPTETSNYGDNFAHSKRVYCFCACMCIRGWDQKVIIFSFPSLIVLVSAESAVTQPECLAWDEHAVEDEEGIIVGGRGLEKLIISSAQ